MGMSSNINNYRHVAPIMDLAVQNRGGLYKMASKGKATRWRMEAYQFKKLISAQIGDGPSKYDDLIMSIEGPNIRFNMRELDGIFVSKLGEEIRPTRQLAEPMDELEKFALALAATTEEDEPDEGTDQ